jgi:hypothetical protein
MRSPVDQLDQELGHPGFWMSYGEEEDPPADQLARALGPDGWAELDRFWRERPAAWQRALATVLITIGPPQTVPWLLEMIERSEDDVALHAIDELRSFQRYRKLHLPWPPAALERVRQLWRARRGFTPTQLEELLDDMARGRL